VARQTDHVFRLLALCAQRPGDPQVAALLPAAVAAAQPGVGIVELAAGHGLAQLLLAHLRAAKAAVLPAVSLRLFALSKLEAHTAAVRARLTSEALDALAGADIPLLVLKGAALAQMVYADAVCRPMRDVDVLIRPRDARRAYETLRQVGFTPGEGESGPRHHHLPGLWKAEDGVVADIELHHELLARVPFVARQTYDDLRPAAQPFRWGGRTLQTLGPEDMLWHLYAHAFVINTLCPGIRLISIADLIHVVETWVDVLDWDLLRRRYGRVVRALPLVDRLAPWSARALKALHVQKPRARLGVRPVSSSLHWSAIASGDVLWPPEWWFRMRYGVDGPGRWLWYRGAGHPLQIAMAVVDTSARRVSRQLWGSRPHRLLDNRVHN
jgi:hypothetical protein